MWHIFLDTETHAKDNPILIQLAYIDWNGLKFEKLFNTWGTKIDFGAMAVHHITEDMIKDCTTFNVSQAKVDLIEQLKEHILVAHNAKFDIWVLNWHGVEVSTHVCTLKIARYVYPEFEQHNLQYLRYRLWLNLDWYQKYAEISAHDAMSDVIVLWELFKKLKDDMIALKGHNELNVHLDMVDISKKPSLLHKCVFGKHAGTLWAEIPKEYLRWIVQQDFDEDVKYTAQFYL